MTQALVPGMGVAHTALPVVWQGLLRYLSWQKE